MIKLWFGSQYENDGQFMSLGVFICLPRKGFEGVEGLLAHMEESFDSSTEGDIEKFLAPWIAYAKENNIPYEYDPELIDIDGDRVRKMDDE